MHKMNNMYIAIAVNRSGICLCLNLDTSLYNMPYYRFTDNQNQRILLYVQKTYLPPKLALGDGPRDAHHIFPGATFSNGVSLAVTK